MDLAATRRTARRETLLLEREGELAALEDAIAAAKDRAGVFVAIEGAAGIGKTSLLAAARRIAADRDVSVLSARGGELERMFAFGVVRQLFEPVLARATPEEREEALSGAAGLAARLFGSDEDGWQAAGGEDAAFAVLHGLYWLVVNLAERHALLLAVDDLHWADRSSLRLLDYLARRLEGLPVAIAATLRPLDVEADPALADLLADPATVVLRPAPLSRLGAGRLLTDRFGSDRVEELASAAHDATGGNPLLMRELLGAVGDSDDVVSEVRRVAPEVISRRVHLQLAKLGPAAAGVAAAIAVLGDDPDVREVAALAGLDPPEAADPAHLLARAEILERGRTLRFVHPLLRRAVYDAIPAGERDAMHGRAADILRAHHAGLERVAAQIVLAPPARRPDAVETLRAAAAASLQAGAAESAVAYLERALAEPPAGDLRADVLLELAAADSLAGTPDAPERLVEAVSLLAPGERRARARLALARALFWRSQEQRAVDEIEIALSEVPVSDAPLRHALQAEYYSAALRLPALHERALASLDAVDVAPDAEDEAARMLLALRSYALSTQGMRRGDAVLLAERALSRGIPTDDTPAWSHWGAVSTLLMADRFEAALPVVDEAIAEARRRGAVYLYCGASMVRASLLQARGLLAEAEADARAAADAVPDRGAMVTPLALGQLAQLLVLRGRPDEAATLLSEINADAAIPETFACIPLLRARGMLRLARGDAAAALADAQAATRAALSVGFRNPVAAPWRTEQATALLAAGNRPQARRLAAAELDEAHRWGAPRGIGRALRVLGLAEGGTRGLTRLEESSRVLEESPALLERALSLVELGAARRRAGRRVDARAPLRDGLELARRCGAGPLAERALTELIASGAKPRSTALSGVESLTPSERRTAAMAAEGMTNPQIAQALFVTLRTVEMHLSNAFRKLDIGSRTQLADALAQAPHAG